MRLRLELFTFEILLLALLLLGIAPLAQGQRMVSLDNEVFPEAITPHTFAYLKVKGKEGGEVGLWLAPSHHATYLCLLTQDVPWPEVVETDSTYTFEFHVRKKPKGPPALVLHEDLDPPVRMDIYPNSDRWYASAPVDMKWFDLEPLYDYWSEYRTGHPGEEPRLEGLTFSSQGTVILSLRDKYLADAFISARAIARADTEVPHGIPQANPDVKFE